MKTTFDLPDDLFRQAKAVALQRRTTLKAMVEHALRREIQGNETASSGENPLFTLNKHGFPIIKKSGQTPVTNRMISDLLEEE